MLGESPVVTVHIPPLLRPYAGGNEETTASGDTVADVLDAVGHEFPALRPHVMQADGSLARDIAVYLGPTCIDDLQGLATPVALEELVSIVHTGSAGLSA